MRSAHPSIAASPTLLIVSEHCLMREGLRVVLAEERTVIVVGCAGSSGEAVRLAEKTKPDIVLMEVDPETSRSVDLTLRILHAAPQTRVVWLAEECDATKLRLAAEAMVVGYLSKAIDRQHLSAALREVAMHGCCRPFAVEGRRISGQNVPVLSSREAEVLELMQRGMSNIDIGKALHIGAQTVLSHAKSLFFKLGVANRAEAVAVGFEHGYLLRRAKGKADGAWSEGE